MHIASFLLDTAYILALFNPRDEYHKKAVELFPQIRKAHEVWITEAVLTEVGNALAKVNRSAAVTFINSCYMTTNVKVVSVDRELFIRAIEFYNNYSDKDWGITDCISFIVMQDNGVTKALTTDDHFQQAGFQVLLR